MKNIFKIIQIAKPLYSTVAIIAILILISSITELLSPIISKQIVDEIVKEISDSDGDLNKLYMLIGISFGLGILSIFLTAITERLGDHFAGEIRKFLTEKFYDKVLSLPQKYFDSSISGKIVNQLSRGIDSIRDFINTSTNFLLPTLLQTTFTIIVLAYYNWMVALFVTILFPIYMMLTRHSSKKWGEKQNQKNEIDDSIRGRLQEVIGNIKLVKSFTNETSEFKYISDKLSTSNKIYAKQSQDYHSFNFVRNLTINIVLLIVSFVIFYNTFNQNLTIGELVLIIQLLAQVRWPLQALSFIYERVQEAESGSKEFFEVLNLDSVENYSLSAQVDKIKNPTIKFKDVTFAYGEEENVLENLSLEIKNNDVVALVGPSGAGKSTIINLIMKFYEPSSGEILLNGKSYKELEHKFIRENISLVFQDNELFSSTILENVAYGQDATKEEVIDALKKANALDFVNKFKDGVDTLIGERGIRLSGGQKQRIQIARAILKNAPILILDEATSSLDAKSELLVQEALETLMKGKLVLVIAHRFSTIQNATKVLVLGDKVIQDFGSPQELAKKDGIYSELLNYQIEGNKKLLQKFDLY